ncbi:MAG: DUF1622 domain-containing protein [Candidatus Bathyarchaeia archaeon]|jgi:uncharacterized membrane protein
MAESQVEKKQGVNSLALILISVVIGIAVFCAVLNFVYPGFVNLLVGKPYVSGGSIYDAIFVVLTVAEYALYLFGGGVVTFGAILVIIRFFQFKLKDPYQASSSTRYLSGYLTLSLNFFIGAEIIRTVATRYFSDFELLLLVIFSRGLFSLILYLERRWHGTAETE